MKSLSEQVDDRSISELQNNNQQLRTSLEHSAYVQSTDLAPFTSGTIVNVKPLQGESKYDYLNNENENIWIVVCSIHGRKYIAEYDLSDEYYRDEFIKLCDFHDVSIDEPINLIGKSNPIQVSSNSGTFSLFYNNYHSYPGTIMRSRFFKTSVSGFQMQTRYFVLSLLIGGISSMGLMYISRHLFSSIILNFVGISIIVLSVLMSIMLFYLLMGVIIDSRRKLYHHKENTSLNV